MSSDVFILLQQMRVQSANAATHYLAVNGPNIYAACGLAHALCRQVDNGVEDLKGVALIKHDNQLLVEARKPAENPVNKGHYVAQQRRGAAFINDSDYVGKKDGVNIPLSMQPTVTRHETLSIVLRMHDEHELTTSVIEKFLHGARFGGGVILPNTQVRIFTNETALRKVLRYGFWVNDAVHLMQQSELPNCAALQDYLSSNSQQVRQAAKPFIKELTTQIQDKEARKTLGIATQEQHIKLQRCLKELEQKLNNSEKPVPVLSSLRQFCQRKNVPTVFIERMNSFIQQYSWLTATTVGYSLVAPLKPRKNVRNDFLHGFAEPLLGLVQYQSLTSSTHQKLPFWTLNWQDGQTFLLTTTSHQGDL